LRDQGAAILIASSELEELTTLCDRILVLSNRKAVKTFKRGEWNNELLLEAAFSQHKRERLVS
jgi:ribose transport system ATP-binding protein